MRREIVVRGAAETLTRVSNKYCRGKKKKRAVSVKTDIDVVFFAYCTLSNRTADA